MFATHSIEGYTQRLIDERGASAEFLGHLSKLYNISGASQSRISQALRGTNPFTHEHEPFRILVQSLEGFLASVEPLPIALRDSALIKKILDEYVETKQAAEALIRPCFIIEFDNQELFAGVVDGKPTRSRDNQTAIAIRDEAVANEAVKLLGG
jgi:hypothetical protein